MLKRIIELYPETSFSLTMDGYNKAIIGVDEKTMKFCYSQKKIIKILMKDMNEEDAVEYFEYNIAGAYMGEKTPIIINDYL